MTDCSRCGSPGAFVKESKKGAIYACTSPKCGEQFLKKKGMLNRIFANRLPNIPGVGFDDDGKFSFEANTYISIFILPLIALTLLAFFMGYAQGTDLFTGLNGGILLVGYFSLTTLISLSFLIPIVGVVLFILDLLFWNVQVALFFDVALTFPNVMFYWIPSITFAVFGILVTLWIIMNIRR